MGEPANGHAERTARSESDGEDAIQQDKLAILGHMAASVAHDLNNPLTSIATSINAALTFLPEKAPSYVQALRDDLMLAVEEAERARHIISGLLEFASRQPSARKQLPLNDIARATARLTAHLFHQDNIALTCECESTLDTTVVGDRYRLLQVAMNLAINSHQALAEQGHRGQVWIRVSREGDRAALTIEDNGPGVAPDMHHTIFSPYYTTKQTGTGLGLCIARQIVEDAGGTLAIEDRREGGARFVVSLPAAKNPMLPETAPTTTPPPPPTGQLRVLVVDDEPSILKSTSRFLRRFGWTADIANDGHEALALMEHNTYDAILSDLRMPGLNGEELFAQVLTRFPHLAPRMAFISGDTMREDTRAFLTRCGCPTLRKPFHLDDLVATIRQCVKADETSVPMDAAS